jgi:phosphatidylinositol alpha-1,6-mannosyltransferase
VSRVLVVTNDFPPRPGGIQTFVHELVRRLPPEQVVVYASTWRDPTPFDAEQAFEVVRYGGKVMLPTPAVRGDAVDLMRRFGATSVLFGAAAPLGLLAPALRSGGAQRLVALTHGHEAGWAQLPAGRQALRRIGDNVDHITYLGEYTRRRIAAALSPVAAAALVRLAPGVDAHTFRPDADARRRVRSELGLGERPVALCVSRLMPRKGQDRLVQAWPHVRAQVPEAVLVIVGGGPYRDRLRAMVDRFGLAADVVMTGSVPTDDLPGLFAAADVFAMPCRTRRRGLDVEGLGIVYLEASATGLPVIAGDSGGAPDAVLSGRTGYVVPGSDRDALVARLVELLGDRALSAGFGEAGRRWVLDEWDWDDQVDILRDLLDV